MTAGPPRAASAVGLHRRRGVLFASELMTCSSSRRQAPSRSTSVLARDQHGNAMFVDRGLRDRPGSTDRRRLDRARGRAGARRGRGHGRDRLLFFLDHRPARRRPGRHARRRAPVVHRRRGGPPRRLLARDAGSARPRPLGRERSRRCRRSNSNRSEASSSAAAAEAEADTEAEKALVAEAQRSVDGACRAATPPGAVPTATSGSGRRPCWPAPYGRCRPSASRRRPAAESRP